MKFQTCPPHCYDIIVKMTHDTKHSAPRVQCTRVLQVVLILLVGESLVIVMENSDLGEYIENGILYFYSVG
jgi:hypothetical protein